MTVSSVEFRRKNGGASASTHDVGYGLKVKFLYAATFSVCEVSETRAKPQSASLKHLECFVSALQARGATKDAIRLAARPPGLFPLFCNIYVAALAIFHRHWLCRTSYLSCCCFACLTRPFASFRLPGRWPIVYLLSRLVLESHFLSFARGLLALLWLIHSR